MKVVQVRLSSESGNSHVTGWIEDKIKPGYRVTLKEFEDMMWVVDSVDSEPVEQSSINRGWNNNI